ncbi:MAG: response regulator, partial [Verrucomicrobiaceae bacterium]
MDILIVDDQKSIRLTTSLALEAEGHYVETAEDGDTCLRRVKEENFELVFLDLRLGDEDGLEILQKIVAMKPQQLVTIFTAHASISTAVKATQLGAFDYLEKPFTPDQLRAILIKAQKALQTQGEVIRLKETPKFLVGDGKDAEAVEVLQGIATRYNRPCSLTLERLQACGTLSTRSSQGKSKWSPGSIGVHLKGLYATKRIGISTTLI